MARKKKKKAEQKDDTTTTTQRALAPTADQLSPTYLAVDSLVWTNHEDAQAWSDRLAQAFGIARLDAIPHPRNQNDIVNGLLAYPPEYHRWRQRASWNGIDFIDLVGDDGGAFVRHDCGEGAPGVDPGGVLYESWDIITQEPVTDA